VQAAGKQQHCSLLLFPLAAWGGCWQPHWQAAVSEPAAWYRIV